MSQYYLFANLTSRERYTPFRMEMKDLLQTDSADLRILETLLKTRWKHHRVVLAGDEQQSYWKPASPDTLPSNPWLWGSEAKELPRIGCEASVPLARYICNRARREYIDRKRQHRNPKLDPLPLLLSVSNSPSEPALYGQAGDLSGLWADTSDSLEFRDSPPAEKDYRLLV